MKFEMIKDHIGKLNIQNHINFKIENTLNYYSNSYKHLRNLNHQVIESSFCFSKDLN